MTRLTAKDFPQQLLEYYDYSPGGVSRWAVSPRIMLFWAGVCPGFCFA
ncbi:putative enzyme [Klebsiella pneumoniae]|nr:hypothetical protein [Klebsiella pneumoniae]SVR55623.1 putative enzyme [Klebsiella pneumoniae]HBR4527098.1 hypothetical protein [Klebsiella pneumoniae]